MPRSSPSPSPSEPPGDRLAVAVGSAALAVDDAVSALIDAYPSAPPAMRAREAIGLAARRYMGALTEAGVRRTTARDAVRARVAHALAHHAGSDVARAILRELDGALDTP